MSRRDYEAGRQHGRSGKPRQGGGRRNVSGDPKADKDYQRGWEDGAAERRERMTKEQTR